MPGLVGGCDTPLRLGGESPNDGGQVCSHARVRLAAWNCLGKFHSNLPRLLELGVDVAVVCEAKAPSAWPPAPEGRAVTGLSRPVPRGGWKELVVLACDPWVVKL